MRWTVHEAAGHVRRMHAEPGVASLVPQLSTAEWAGRLPTVYTSLKGKCWSEGGRVCGRPQHSCVRRIASWMLYPGRPALRRCGRAWRLALRELKLGVATASLARAATDLRRVAQSLRGAPSPTCHECGMRRRGVTATVLDASAMYERICPSQVLEAAAVVLRYLRSCGRKGVVVYRTRRLYGRSVRASGSYACDRVYISLADMFALLRLGVNMRWATFGDAVFMQRAGLPIGGPLSDLGAGLLLGLQEQAWQAFGPLRVWSGFRSLARNGDYAERIAQVRYVDDVLTLSTSLCCSCSARMVKQKHPGVPFEVEEVSSSGPVRWLDLLVHLGAPSCHLALLQVERPWLSGADAVPKAYRVPPWLGADRPPRRMFAHPGALVADPRDPALPRGMCASFPVRHRDPPALGLPGAHGVPRMARP